MANTPVAILDDTMTDIADAIRAKNGSQATMKPGQMATAIASIPSGGGVGIPRKIDGTTLTSAIDDTAFATPLGIQTIGVSALSNAFYNSNQGLESSSAIETLSLPDVVTIQGSGMSQAFFACLHLTTINAPNLTTIQSSGMHQCFRYCEALTTINMPNLTTLGDSALQGGFYGCTSLTSVSLTSLATLTSNSALESAFQGCSNLASVDLRGLTTVSSSGLAYAFSDCRLLASVNLSSLSTLNSSNGMSYAFRNCISLSSLSFPSLTTSSFGNRTNQFNNMLSGCSNVTVHFPAAIQSTIGSWASVTSGFDGTNTTVLFDL